MNYQIRKDCRLCLSPHIELVLELKDTPLANEFVSPEAANIVQPTYPLYLCQCRACGHVQLPVIVDPAKLFADYVYVSGTSSSFVEHFRRYAESVIDQHKLRPGDLVVEVGSNDGTLLRFFKEAGMRVLGIDPAQKIAAEATLAGIETRCNFFDRRVAAEIKKEFGVATVVLANNVFAHADDLHEIALGIRDLLDEKRGAFVFEVQYLVDLIENTLFDMVNHEHLSYHSLKPLVNFFVSLSMSVVDVERVPTHGGSIRVTTSPIRKISKSARVNNLLALEDKSLQGDAFKTMAIKIDQARNSLTYALDKEPGKIVGYGAPAKMTTLMYHFGLHKDKIDFVIDDSPWKQGLLTPGLHLPVQSPAWLDIPGNKPDCIVIFAWNFATQIVAKYPTYRGKFIAPLPTFTRL
jgi:SAM-dependent methyltransferase